MVSVIWLRPCSGNCLAPIWWYFIRMCLACLQQWWARCFSSLVFGTRRSTYNRDYCRPDAIAVGKVSSLSVVSGYSVRCDRCADFYNSWFQWWGESNICVFYIFVNDDGVFSYQCALCFVVGSDESGIERPEHAFYVSYDFRLHRKFL